MSELSGEQLPQFEGSRVAAKQHGEATFMTQVSNPGPGFQSQKTKQPPKVRAKEYGEDEEAARGPSTLTGGKETDEADDAISN